MLRRLMILTIMGFSMLVVACEPDTTGERIADSMENLGDDLQDFAEDVGNVVEDACEELKQEAGAKGTNC